MKNIANAVGITPASIYNHYSSKEMILEAAYDMYTEHCFDTRMMQDQYDPILHTGSARDIIQILNYPLAEPMDLMFSLTRIVFARIYNDPVANEIYKQYVVWEGQTYIQQVLNRGREIGRIVLDQSELFSLSNIILGCRLMSASAVIIDPDQKKMAGRGDENARNSLKNVGFEPANSPAE